MESALRKTISNRNIDRSDALFLNVHYDKQLIDINYVDTLSNDTLYGKTVITNRQTILDFLKKAEELNTYRYIFLDIRFEEGEETTLDSVLFSQIKKMNNVSFSRHSNKMLPLRISSDDSLMSKALINDFYTTITSTNFTRYAFIQNHEHSVPLKIFETTDSLHRTIRKIGPFYFSGGALCQNSPYLTISSNFLDYKDEIGHTYYDLGPFFLDDTKLTDKAKANLMKNKIIFIGDFIDDIHDTYVDSQPGAYIVYLAYKELKNNDHVVSIFFLLIMFAIYFIITYGIISDYSLLKILPCINNINNELLKFILNFFGYMTVLGIITLILYCFFYSTYSVFIPTLFFSFLKAFRPMLRMYYHKFLSNKK